MKHLGLVLVLAVSVVAPAELHAENRSGYARVIDGDTLEVQGQRVRLVGIDAPESTQVCSGAGGAYPCGLEATGALRKLIGSQVVRCVADKADRYKRPLAICHAGAVELNRELVRQGWAIAYLGADYLSEQSFAQAQRAGLWAGDFKAPQEFRRGDREAPQTAQERSEPQGLDVQSAICAASAIMTSTVTPAQMVCFLKFFASISGPAPAQGGAGALIQRPAPTQMPQSIAEVGQMIIKCYHPTGEFVRISVMDHPWRDQHAYWNATHSALLRIDWRGGFVGTPYWTVVGVVERNGHVRAVVQDESAAFRASRSCALNDWVSIRQ